MAYIIMDFDGTIADSFEVIANIFYSLTRRHTKLKDEEIKKLRHMSVQEIVKKLGISKWKLLYLLFKGRQMMTKEVDKIELCHGMGVVIERLSQDNKLFIISSNSRRNVKRFLIHKDLDKYFSGVIGGAGIFNKGTVIERFLSVRKFDKDKCFYVGDESRDVEAAEKAGISCISVLWGFSSKKELQVLNPYAIVDKPKDLLRILNKNAG